jgi:hypothetical protein
MANMPKTLHALNGLTCLNTVSDVKEAIMFVLKLHPAKQSLYFVHRRSQTMSWMQEGQTLSSYASNVLEDIFIRVYSSFELVFKYQQRWIIIPSATSDSVFDLKSKLSREISAAAHQLSIFFPAQAAPAVARGSEQERELVHQEGKTLLSFGITGDLELEFQLEANELAATATAASPAVSLLPNNTGSSTSLAIQPLQPVGNRGELLAVDSMKISIELGNFGDIRQTTLVVPFCQSLSVQAHLKHIHRHIQEKFHVHIFHQDIW